MGCNEKCTASELSGLAERNIEYCQGLVDVDFNDSDLKMRNVCGALIMAKVTHGQINPSEISRSQGQNVELDPTEVEIPRTALKLLS